MIDRLKFWLARKHFLYTASGRGIAFESYNPLTDKVLVRASQFGYVTGREQISRCEYLSVLAAIRAGKVQP
jgi:hypothetical protein